MNFRRRCVCRLHMKGADSPSLEGVLMRVSRDHYELANARHIVSPDDSFNLDGVAMVPRENVLYLQRLG